MLVTRATMVTLLAAALALPACPKKEPAKAPGGEVSAPASQPAPPDPAVADIPLDPAAERDPSRVPAPPEEPPLEVAVRYIQVLFDGAQEAPEGTTRTREEALRRARRLVEVARRKGSDFAALARRYSEAAEESRGKVEVFRPGQTEEAFEKAAFGLRPGQVSAPAVTSRGVYVIERVPLEEYSTAHILVMYKGSRTAPQGLTRTKEEAREKAEKVREKAAGGQAPFAVLASRYSDSPSGRLRGGVIAPIGPHRLLPGMEPYLDAVRALKVGDVSQVVETPYGFHVIKRLPLKKIVVAHVLIGWRGSDASNPRERRTKAQARRLAAKVRAEARAEGADFAELAKTYSDGPSADNGGRLPPFARGEMVPKFEQHAFALKVGQVSDVVETRFGYHVIKRLR